MTDEPRTAESTGADAPQTMEFRAEVQQLLSILAHSLYTEREIFLRELISNASDALHRIQFEMLTNRDVIDPDAELAIRIETDPEARTLTISDTGVGMTHDELIENLGTIAHSGALAFMQKMREGQKPGRRSTLSGSSASASIQSSWSQTRSSSPPAPIGPVPKPGAGPRRGDSRFTLAPADKATRGTEIFIKLKEDAQDFAASWRLETIIRRHSNYVSFPIYLKGEVVNQRTALWRTPMSEVKPDEYDEFYRQLTLDPEPPLLHTHVITDAPVEIRAVLYVPRKVDRGVFSLRSDYGLRLYSRKVLIQEHNKELLPEYLRFVEGVVDSEDIPLNVSRETVQSNRVLRAMQKVLAGRVVKVLNELADEKPDEYAAFWSEMGPFIKQGVAMGAAEKDELLTLLRFPSTRSEGKAISLAEYAGRMAEGQEEIYYLLGSDPLSVATSPHLDPFKARNLEVLLLADPFDGYMMQSVHEFQGKQLRNVDDPGLSLPAVAEQPAEASEPVADAEWAEVVARFKTVLGDRVTEVRESQLLTDSPARLVSTNTGFEREMQRVRRLIEDDYKTPPKILELNRRHPLIRNLAARIAGEPGSPVVDPAIELLFDNLLLLEGLHPNPAGMAPRIQMMLERATR